MGSRRKCREGQQELKDILSSKNPKWLSLVTKTSTGLYPVALLAKGGPMEIPKQISLLLRQWISLNKQAPIAKDNIHKIK